MRTVLGCARDTLIENICCVYPVSEHGKHAQKKTYLSVARGEQVIPLYTNKVHGMFWMVKTLLVIHLQFQSSLSKKSLFTSLQQKDCFEKFPCTKSKLLSTVLQQWLWIYVYTLLYILLAYLWTYIKHFTSKQDSSWSNSYYLKNWLNFQWNAISPDFMTDNSFCFLFASNLKLPLYKKYSSACCPVCTRYCRTQCVYVSEKSW